jgi:glycosyltransferase involved in cell wall biosynthesis
VTLKKPPVAFVVQRCGLDVNGGAEAMCLAIARELSSVWNIEILTTRALDYMSWQNHYKAGIEMVDSVRIRRFSVDHCRNVEEFNALSENVLPRAAETSDEVAEQWMLSQGPLSSELTAWIRSHADHYAGFFFFTYLYATTYQNLQIVADKAVLIPNAHDEAPIYLPIFRKLFTQPRFWLCNTQFELNFLRSLFTDYSGESDIVALGMKTRFQASASRFRSQFNIDDPFILYVGRIDPSKGCEQLFDFWNRYKRERPSSLKLVLAGRANMDVPLRSDIVPLGFIDEQTKLNAIAACECLVNPSPYESLSMVLLEAWMQEKLTLVNAKCAVLKEQSIRSNGGLWYETFEEFSRTLSYILTHEWSFSGMKFVRENYSWDAVKAKYQNVLDRLNETRILQLDFLPTRPVIQAAGAQE